MSIAVPRSDVNGYIYFFFITCYICLSAHIFCSAKNLYSLFIVSKVPGTSVIACRTCSLGSTLVRGINNSVCIPIKFLSYIATVAIDSSLSYSS